MDQNMNKSNPFHRHFKSDSSSDSEEEMFCNIKKMKTNNELTEDNNESSHQLFASNAFKPSKSLQIIENCESKPQKRFSIWSDLLMEEELNHNINNSMNIKKNKFKSKSNKMDRNCENYSFWTKKELENKTSDQSIDTKESQNGNNSNDNKNSNNKMENNSRKRKKKNKKRKVRRDIPMEIALKLKEPKVDLMRRTVEAIGESKALELCSSTLNIESVGGLMTADGSRRRSSGGVFFQLLKNDPKITKESIDYIFFDEQQVIKRKKKVSKRAKRRLLNNLNKSIESSLTVSENKVESISFETMIPEEENCEKSSLNIPLETKLM